MTDRTAPVLTRTRLAACLAAAGLLFAATAAAQTRLPPPQYGQADVRQDRIEELEGQLRESTAENERLQYEVLQRDREIQRLRGMVGELAGVNQSLATTPPEGPAEAPRDPAASPAPAQSGGGSAALNPSQRAATGTLGTLPADAAPPPAAQSPQVDPGTAYTRARVLLNNGDLAEAEVAFSDFLRDYPEAQMAGDARFLLAYTMLARNNYRDAAATFAQYLQANPRGARAAEAQVRLGMALAGLSTDGQNDAAERRQACAAFTSLPRQHPNASRTVRELAAREALAARCAA